MKINELKNDHKNARKRTDRSSALIKESLKKYGAGRSIVIDEENRILAGNGTIAGARAAGIKNVRVIETEGDEIIAVKRKGLSEDQKVGLALADNRTSDLSEWDKEMLHQLSEDHDIDPFFTKIWCWSFYSYRRRKSNPCWQWNNSWGKSCWYKKRKSD